MVETKIHLGRLFSMVRHLLSALQRTYLSTVILSCCETKSRKHIKTWSQCL